MNFGPKNFRMTKKGNVKKIFLMLDKKRGLIGKKNQGVVLIKKWGEKQKSTEV